MNSTDGNSQNESPLLVAMPVCGQSGNWEALPPSPEGVLERLANMPDEQFTALVNRYKEEKRQFLENKAVEWERVE
jgi:hypothetical protein